MFDKLNKKGRPTSDTLSEKNEKAYSSLPDFDVFS
jgi:hypothetical protein